MTRKTYRKIITTPELIEQINPENKNFVNSFLKEKSTRTSPGTIEGYRSDLNIFFVWNLQENNNKSFVTIRKLELANFPRLPWALLRDVERAFHSSIQVARH